MLVKAGVTMSPGSRSHAGLIRGFQGIQKIHPNQWEMSHRDCGQPWHLSDTASPGLVRLAKPSGQSGMDDMVTCCRKAKFFSKGPLTQRDQERTMSQNALNLAFAHFLNISKNLSI